MKLPIAALLAAVAAGLSMSETQACPPDQWVVVTRPMIACWSMGTEGIYADEMIPRLNKARRGWRPGRAGTDECPVLKTGEKYIVQRHQPKGAILLYDWCTSCSPYLWDLYTPTRAQVGAYLKPTRRPKGIGPDFTRSCRG